MQIFLLNDHLLIASRKKRKVDGPNADLRGPMTKLVADRCWHLLDVEVVDMAGTSESSSGRNKLADAVMALPLTHVPVVWSAAMPLARRSLP